MDSDNDYEQGILACAADLLAAIEAKDVHGIAAALKSASMICDSEPEMSGE